MSAWAADPWCSSRGTPALQFEWVPKNTAEPSIGSVQIKAASGVVVQVIDNVENYRENSESLDTGRDWNNDGCADLVVTRSVGGSGNESVDAFLYNPKIKQFELNKALSDLGSPELDPNDRNCLTSSWKGGHSIFYGGRHCWSKGKLVMKSKYSVGPVDKNGEFHCYRHVTIDYRGGKKRKRTKCTKEWPP